MTDPAQPIAAANAENEYKVTRDQLPVHCPLPDTTLWNSHPRVYIPVADTGPARCPYCGAEFILVDASGTD